MSEVVTTNGARLLLITSLVTALVVAAAARQERHPVSGRIIAPTMGVQGAPWLDRPERESEEQPTRAVDVVDVYHELSGPQAFIARLKKSLKPDGQWRRFETNSQRTDSSSNA